MKLRVLALDDDEGLLKSLTGMVSELGHEALFATSTEKAFEILQNEQGIDVILADVRLPEQSGIEFLKQAKSRDIRAAVVLMTAFSDIDLAVMALETGAFGFLRKPFALKELEVLLRNVMNTMRLEEHNIAMRRLIEALEVVNTNEPIDESQLGRLLSIAISATRSSSGSILILDASGEGVKVGAFKGMNKELMDGIRSSLKNCVAGKVLENNKSVIFDERLPANDPYRALMKRQSIVSAICAPMSLDGVNIGVLSLNRTEDGDLFDESDRDLAEVFARAMALAIENSRLQAEQRLHYEQYQKMQRQLIQTEKLSSLGQLAAGIAHEVNNPLTSVMGFAELLLRRAKDEKEQEFLGKIVSNAERIKRILLDLKDFYIPSKNRMNYVDVNRIIENAIPIVRVHPESSGVTIVKQLKTPLPELFCDENQILQVLINLIINAFQAMPDGGQITVSSTHEHEQIIITVKDTGVGIASEHVNKIFDPFFTTKSDWKGTGLGLSVCYTIIDNHNGQIDVESREGEGSSFIIKLPIGRRRNTLDGRDGGDCKLPKGKILIVDDEADCRELLRTVLAELGFEVDEAHDGFAAVEKLRSYGNYALVFLDYKMPGMNGAKTYNKLREIEPDIKVIVLTGSIGESARMIVEMGAQGFITKPFKMDEVELRIRKVLGKEFPE